MEEISIKVNICDRFYPLRIHAGFEESVRAAAKLANDKAKNYTENYSVKDKQDALAMASLDLATDLISSTKQTSGPTAEVDMLLKDINRLLDSKLV
ncbi:MAG: cell division protein ZapA [Bacteroidetes bacterium]|nr:MAG: cell division protein ZapA [Bacteroidota bacterium]